MSARSKKGHINITNIEEKSVIQHIIVSNQLVDGGKSKKKGTKKNGQDLVYSPSCAGKQKPGYVDVEDADSDTSNDMVMPKGCPMDTEPDEDAMYGGEVFKFRTPKKSGQMVLKAEDCITPKTPGKLNHTEAKSARNTPSKYVKSDSNGIAAKTPRRSLKSGTAQNTPADTGQDTPAGKGQNTPAESSSLKNGVEESARDHRRTESTTPYRLRKRHQELEEAESSSDDSVDECSEDDEEDEDKNFKSKQQAQRADDGLNMAATAEAYFDLHSMASVTSDRTLANLDGPRMDVSAVREALKGVDLGHKKELNALRESHQELFNRWMLHMCHGYNILLYGLGSKRSLLDDFRTQHIAKFSHVVVNGYFPSLTVKHILNAITEEIMVDAQTTFSNPNAHVKYIKDAYKNKDEDFFLIIHNIDGVLLRSDKAQAVLSSLAQVEGFHVIASVDHINAPFLWDQTKCFRFRWLWFEVATFQPYDSENAYENSLLVQQSGALALSSILHVMHSLTPNGRRIFLLLAQHQLDLGDNSTYIGMSFQNLYQQCREAFLVNSDLTLQAQLVEFRDHRLIRSKKNYEGIEHLQIPVDKCTLTEFMKEYKDGS